MKVLKIKFFIMIIFLTTLLFNSLYALDFREKDKKCMEECHSKDIKYNPYGYFGNLKSIKIDYELFLKSKHGAFLCVECHFDVDGGEKTHYLKAPSIKCESCHINEENRNENIKKLLASKDIEMDDKKIVYEEYRNSVHGMAFYENKRNAPYCTGCHNPHNANLKSPFSDVSKDNLPKTCGRCHPNESFSGESFLQKLSLLRVNAHKKGDSAIDYSSSNCIACHSNVFHTKNKENLNGCMTCHKKKAQLFFADFHGNNISLVTLLINFGFIFSAIIFAGAGIGYLAGKQKEIKKEDEKH